MLNKDGAGICRYLSMQADTALIYVSYGFPVREAIALTIQEALVDQAKLCDLAVKDALSGNPEALRAYLEKASDRVLFLMPATGVDLEIPMPPQELVNRVRAAKPGTWPQGVNHG